MFDVPAAIQNSIKELAMIEAAVKAAYPLAEADELARHTDRAVALFNSRRIWNGLPT